MYVSFKRFSNLVGSLLFDMFRVNLYFKISLYYQKITEIKK